MRPARTQIGPVAAVAAAMCLGGCYRTVTERLPVRGWETERVRTGTVIEHDVEQLTVEGRLAAPSGRVALGPVEAADGDTDRASRFREALAARLEGAGLDVVAADPGSGPDWVLAVALAPETHGPQASGAEARLEARRPGAREPFLRETVRGAELEALAEAVASWVEPRTVEREVEREVPWYSLRRQAVVRYEETERQVFAGRLVVGSTVASRLEPAIYAAHLSVVVGVHFEEEGAARDHLVTVETGLTVPTGNDCSQSDVYGGFRARYELRVRHDSLYLGPQLALGGYGAERDECDDEAIDFTTRYAFDFASVAAVGGVDLGPVAFGLDARFGYGLVKHGGPEDVGLIFDLGAQMTFTY